MDKQNSKPHRFRICLLAILSAMFWFLIFYLHFPVVNPSPPLPDKPVITFPSTPTEVKHSSVISKPVNPAKSYVPLVFYPINNYSVLTKNKQEVIKPENNFPFIKALKTTENKSDPCAGRYICVHDFPFRFDDDMLKDCRKLILWTNMCKFTTNAGLGPPLENMEGVFSDMGRYATNHFAVDVIFSNRMKQRECLTKDSTIAAVYVPFYAGFDIARYLWGYNIFTRDAASSKYAGLMVGF